ncbi:CD63 antigen-like isoform X1 [Lytechinus pictus]|uniref:CD63 antigen-like isoform X1 n=1 Tax=Lytechinus pictus TaxID=7653 RepID=UPI0030BA2195
MEGSAKCIKYLMFFFNFIFFIFGLGIIIGGSLTLTLYSEYVDFTGNTGTAIPIALICIGVFIFLTGFFGCCGAVKENYCMLATFAFIMVLLLILELAAGISGYVKRDDIDNLIDDNMSELQQTYNESESTKDLFDNMQKNLECCGTLNYTSWFGFNDTAGYNVVPMSCCITMLEGCNSDVSRDPFVAERKIHVYACYPALKDLLIGNIGIIAGVAIAIAVIEIFGIAFACCLMRYVSGPYVVVVQSSNQGT